jgi:hypothetical protein
MPRRRSAAAICGEHVSSSKTSSGCATSTRPASSENLLEIGLRVSMLADHLVELTLESRQREKVAPVELPNGSIRRLH